MKKKLILVRGVPGSGKSTFSSFITSDYHVEADMYFMNPDGEYKFEVEKLADAHQWCHDSVEEKMVHLARREFSTIVISNTFTREWEMEAYFQLAKAYGYEVFTVVVENRHGGKNTHGCPEETVEAMRARFELKL
jgi:predicted kinase